MTPPPRKDGSPDLKAPLRDWKVGSHLLASHSECERLKKASTDFADNEAKQFIAQHFKNLSPSDLALIKAAVSHAVCVSSDDPRLKGK